MGWLYERSKGARCSQEGRRTGSNTDCHRPNNRIFAAKRRRVSRRDILGHCDGAEAWAAIVCRRVTVASPLAAISRRPTGFLSSCESRSWSEKRVEAPPQLILGHGHYSQVSLADDGEASATDNRKGRLHPSMGEGYRAVLRFPRGRSGNGGYPGRSQRSRTGGSCRSERALTDEHLHWLRGMCLATVTRRVSGVCRRM